MATSVMWFRRDLRLADNPALLAAAEHGKDGVVPLFVVDETLWSAAGPSRRAYLRSSLDDLGSRVEGLQIRRGDPVHEVESVARAAGAETVHIAADYGPYGSDRDTRVEKALAEHDITLERLGSPYAVAPGRVTKDDGSAYRVYTPFSKVWAQHGWRAPAESPRGVSWIRPMAQHRIPAVDLPDGLALPSAGEAAARKAWHAYVDRGLSDYGDLRDRPDLDATSHMSVHLKWGEIHPRTLLADLAKHSGRGAQSYRREIAFREFYADVLWQVPSSAREYLRPEFAQMDYARPGRTLDAWREGRTGFPIVDAGMRQLRAEGWMHNRVRMIVASFLVKDLHVEWQHGARHFMHWLVDGDLASNMHGWQWVAGCGTDAAPYFRVFNPITQGQKFDPDGDYIRRYVPELSALPGGTVHEPWDADGGLPDGYPERIVDHKEQRRVALERYDAIR